MPVLGLLRGFGAWFFRAVLVLLILSAVMMTAASHLTSEQFMKPAMKEMIAQQIRGNAFDETYEEITSRCGTEGKEILEFQFELTNSTIKISCVELEQKSEEEGKEYLIEIFAGQIADSMFKEVYYKKVCEGMECFEKIKTVDDPTKLITADFNKFLKSTVKFLVALAVIAALGVVLLSKGISGRIFGLGYPLLIAGLPYFGISIVKAKLVEMFPARVYFLITELTTLLAGIYLKILISGAVLLALGLVMKFIGKRREKKKGKKK